MKKLSKEVRKLLRQSPAAVQNAIKTAAQSNTRREVDRARAELILAKGPTASREELEFASRFVASELGQ